MKRIVEKLDSIEASSVKNLNAVGVQIFNKKFVLAMSDVNTIHLVTLDIEKTFKVFVEPSYKSIEDFMYRRPDAECFLFDNKKELVQWVFDIELPQSADSVGEENAVKEKQTEHKYWKITSFIDNEYIVNYIKTPISITIEEASNYAEENDLITCEEWEEEVEVKELSKEEYDKKAVEE